MKLDTRPNVNMRGNNSEEPNAALPEKKKIEKPVLSPDTTVKKPSVLAKVKDTFFHGRNFGDVCHYVVTEIVAPTIIDGIANASKAAIDGFLYGEARPRNSSSYGNQKTNYGSLSRPGSGNGGIVVRGGNGSKTDYSRIARRFENVVISNRRDAENILQYLIDYIEEYNYVTVADFYDLFDEGAPESKFTDNNWGWKNLNGVRIDHVPGGWQIDFPEVQRVD